MRDSWLVFLASFSVLASGLVAMDSSAQCSGGGGTATASTGASVATSTSTSPLALMNSAYPSSRGYSIASPMAYQRSVYQQIAYQQQLNFQRQMMLAAKQQAARTERLNSTATLHGPSNYNALSTSAMSGLSSSNSSDANESESPAERLFVLATRAEKAGRDSTAERYYKRVVAMAPNSNVASLASDKLSQIK